MPELSPYWMILFLLAAGHGLFLSSLLALRSKQYPGLKYLSILILLFAVSLLYYVAFWMDITPKQTPLWGLILTFPTLYGPLVYAYFQKLNNQRINFWLHATPFFLHFAYMTGCYGNVLGIISWTPFNASGAFGFTIVQNVSLVMYAIILARISVAIGHKYGKTLEYLYWAFVGFTLSFLCYYVLVYTIDLQPKQDYVISLFMTVFMYLVGYLFYGGPVGKFYQKRKNKTYQNSGLTRELAKAYRVQLLNVMDTQQPYLNGDLKLQDLANLLEMSSHHLSELINSEIGMNFSEFLNQYRVREAQVLLSSNQKITEVGYQAGFNNKTSFSQTFKKYTGMTPSQYRVQLSPSLKKHPI